MWCYGPNLAELKSEPICYKDVIIFLVTLIIYFAIKLIKRVTTFQTKSPIAAWSNLPNCHRKIVKSGLKFSQKFFIRKFGIVVKVTDCDAQGRGFESRQSWAFKVSRLNKRRKRSFCSKVHKSLNLPNLTKNILLNFISQPYLKIDRTSKLIDFFVNYPSLQSSKKHSINQSLWAFRSINFSLAAIDLKWNSIKQSELLTRQWLSFAF